MPKEAKPVVEPPDQTIAYAQAPPLPRPVQIRDTTDPNRLYGMPQGTAPPPPTDEEMAATMEVVELEDPEVRAPPKEVE